MGPRYAALPSTIPVEPFSPPFHLTFHRLLPQRLSLIKKFLSLCKTQIHFDLAIHKVEFERNQGIPSLLHFADQPLDFPLVKEEFPGPQWVMVQPVRLGIGTDMSIDKKDLAPFDISVTISQVDLSIPQGFDLRSREERSRPDRSLQ